jgi:hypothetical protein
VSTPELGVSLHIIYARNDQARRIIAGFASAMPAASEMWERVDRALADVPALGAVIARLSAELADTRMDRANLLVAMRATIAAHADGEPDPLYYPGRVGRPPGALPGPPGGIVNSYRQMRRHARQARRAGMQPMMVINSGDPFPELVIVVIARWAWRYRSELAPLGVALLVAGFGWYAHAALRGWWPVILAGSGTAAWVLAVFGAKLGIPARLERGSRWPPRSARWPRRYRRCSASALRCWRSRGGRTAGAARRSAWNVPSRRGRTSPGAPDSTAPAS